MFICNTICDPEFTNYFILVDQMSHGISKSPMNFRPIGPIDTCSPNPRNNSDLYPTVPVSLQQISADQNS